MKSHLLTALAILLIATFTGCNGEENPTSADNGPEPASASTAAGDTQANNHSQTVSNEPDSESGQQRITMESDDQQSEQELPEHSSRNDGAATVRIGSIDWYVNYDQALEVARESGKPLWLHFGENPG